MATPGLRFPAGQPADPYSPANSTAGAGLAPSLADMASTAQSLITPAQIPSGQVPRPADIAYSASRKQLYVQGTVFDEDDATAALQAQSLLGGPGVGLPTEGDWQPLDEGAYQQFLDSIRDPGRGRLFRKGFQTGAQQLKSLAGSALQLAGAEQFGGRMVSDAQREIEKRAPFAREFTDVDSASTLVDWFVSTLGTQGPMLLESVALGLAGAAAGTATAGPGLGTAGGFIAGLFGKKKLKDKVIEAAAKYRAGQVGKDSAEYALLRRTSALTGALAANYAGSYAIGAGDIYGEMREQGVTADNFAARLSAAALALPYSALEGTADVFIAGRILGAGGRAALPQGASRLRRGAEYGLIRPLQGAGVYGLAEGLTEVGQEAIVMAGSGQDLTSDEALTRFVNGFAAGAAVGGAIGGVANLRSRKPDGTPAPETKAETNLLDNPAPPGQMELFPDQFRGAMGPTEPTENLALRGELFDKEGNQIPATARSELLREQNQLVELLRRNNAEIERMASGGAALNAQRIDTLRAQNAQIVDALTEVVTKLETTRTSGVTPQLPGQMALFRPEQKLKRGQPQAPELQPGQQGVMDIGIPGQPLSDAERLLRGQPRPQPTEDITQEQLPLFADQSQGVLQFAPPAPEGIGFTDLLQPVNPLMAERMQPVARQIEFTAAEQQRAEAEQAQRDRDYEAAQRQQQLQIMEDDEALAAEQAEQELPRREAGPVQPVQLPLFTEPEPEPEAPRPSRREALRKGIPGARRAEEQPEFTSDVEAQKQRQLSLFTQAGEPTVAALKGAGTKTKLKTPAKKAPAKKSAGARGLKRGTKVSEITVTETQKVETPGEKSTRMYAADIREIYEKLTDIQKAAVAAELGLSQDEVVAQIDKPTQAQIENIDDAIATVRRRPAPKVPEKTWAAAGTGISWDALTEEYKARWMASDQTADTAEKLLDQYMDTPLYTINEAIASFEEARNAKEQEAALTTIVDAAFFLGKDSADVQISNRAEKYLLDYLNSPIATASEQEMVDGLVISLGSQLSSIEAMRAGQTKPWFNWASQRGLLGQISTTITGIPNDMAVTMYEQGTIRLDQLPESKQKHIIKTLGLNKVTTKGAPDTRNNPGTQLGNMIAELNGRTTTMTEDQQKKTTKKLADMFAALTDEQKEMRALSGFPVSDYFTGTGQPKINVINQKLRVGVTKLNAEQIRAAEVGEREAATAERDIALTESRDPSVVKLKYSFDAFATGAVDRKTDTLTDTDPDGSGMAFRNDGTPITTAVPVGRIKLLVSSFLSKLSIKPKVSIYKDQADFKARNPALYAKAVAARPQGDFDTASVVGYSFGDGQVIIFSDRVATEQQLRFVLAHETLGHFGFRGLLTPKQLNAALDAIYNSSKKVAAGVDAYMAARPQMSRREATEEYLADYAGSLDTNVLARFWNSIKNFLNKLGVTFEDDMARYFVSQSRRYVRNGTTNGSLVSFAEMADRINAIETMEDPDGSGRFALSQPYYDEVNHIAVDNAFSRRTTNFADLERLQQAAKDSKIKVSDFMERVRSELTTMNYEARRNQGYRALYRVMQDTVRAATQLRSKYNNMMRTTLTPAVEAFGRKWSSGASQKDLAQVNKMLNVTSASRHGVITDAALRKMGDLVVIKNGEPTIDPDVYKALREKGMISLQEFQQGFEYTERRSRAMTPERRAELERERDAALATETDEKTKAQITREYQKRIDSDTADFPVTVKLPAMPELTADSLVWKMYTEVRNTMDESAIDVLLSNYKAAKAEQVRIQSIAQRMLRRPLGDEEKAYLEKVSEIYLELAKENAQISDNGELKLAKKADKTAKNFMIKWNESLLANERDKYPALKEFLTDAQYDDVVAGIDSLKAGSKIPAKGDIRFSVQNAIENLVVNEGGKIGAELYAKRSIAGGYVPFGRDGIYQVRVVVKDATTGRIYKPSEEYRQQLMFMQVEDRAEAERVAEEVNALFEDSSDDGLYDVSVYEDGEYKTRRVKMVAQYETTRLTEGVASEVNLNDFLRTMTTLGISITPTERSRLFQGLTRQDARARTRLQRLNIPGQDPNTIKYVSKHLEGVASIVARKENRHRIDKLYNEEDPDSKKLWYGDEVEYNLRKKAWEDAQKDPAMSEVRRNAIKQDFVDYHYTYVTNESKVMGNRYLDRGRKLVAFLEAQTSVEFSDFGSDDFTSRLRMWTTFAQLGGSLATGVLNVISLTTNVLPSMAGHNDKNGFGGGFGWGRATTTLTNAMNQVKNPAQSDVAFWDDLLANPDKLKASGFTEVEARFMQKEVSAGSMQAQLFNALLGSARGKITSGLGQRAVKSWMSLFSYTEQAARRATGLATFRLKYAQALQEGQAAGLKDAELQQFAFDKADQFAVDMIDNTLGEYAMFNRPAFFRGDVRQFIFMYKMFPINSVLMLSSMDKKTVLGALGILVFWSGLRGLPGAEDLMDIIDTIAQTLGLGPGKVWKGTAEQSAMELIETVFPGMTPKMWRGFMNSFTPFNVSDRTSLANLVPGTGIGLAGANVGRELVEVMGPIASFLQQSVATGTGLTKYALETVGLKEDTTSLTSLARGAPVTMIRAFGDIAAYNSSGAIVNQQGSVVSKDLTMATYIARAVGFYPSAAVRENDVVRMSTRLTNYQREISAQYRQMYVSARLANDQTKAREVVQMVRDWNAAARGTGLEVPNFQANANRALREARRPASERLRKSAARDARGNIDNLRYLSGLED